MSDKKQEDEILDHNYDGIQEYDNDLPKWWLWLFWLGIFFGIVYVAYFHVGPGAFRSQQLASDMEELQSLRSALQEENESAVSEETLLAFANVAENVSKGAVLYQGKCMACHLDKGQGLIGPNLTDDYWIHGGSLMDIRNIILKGVVDKGMIAWETVLSETEVQELVAFIHSLRGTNPAGAKEAQGEEFIYGK